MRLRHVLLLCTCTLALLRGAGTPFAPGAPAAARPDRVRGIRWYYLPLSSFARYSIDSFNIRTSRLLEGRAPRPAAFLQRLQRSLGPCPAPLGRPFEPQLVRMRCDVTYASGRTESLLVDGGRRVWWRHQTFVADSAAEAVLLSLLNRQQQQKYRVGRYAPKRRY
jgi:hypothetical protein